IPERNPRIVCPTFQVPVGTGIGIFGGNGDIVRDNYFYDNWRDAVKLLYVPAAVRGEPDKGIDTSFDDKITDNHMGVRPDGTRDPNGNDVWWDEQGRGNCFSGNVGPNGAAPTSHVVTGLPACPGSRVLMPGLPGKPALPPACGSPGPPPRPPVRPRARPGIRSRIRTRRAATGSPDRRSRSHEHL